MQYQRRRSSAFWRMNAHRTDSSSGPTSTVPGTVPSTGSSSGSPRVVRRAGILLPMESGLSRDTRGRVHADGSPRLASAAIPVAGRLPGRTYRRVTADLWTGHAVSDSALAEDLPRVSGIVAEFGASPLTKARTRSEFVGLRAPQDSLGSNSKTARPASAGRKRRIPHSRSPSVPPHTDPPSPTGGAPCSRTESDGTAPYAWMMGSVCPRTQTALGQERRHQPAKFGRATVEHHVGIVGRKTLPKVPL